MAKDVRQLEDQYFLNTYAKRGNLMIDRGEGAWVYDDKGGKYLDFTTSLGIASMGHSNPRLQKALSDQAGKLYASNTSYYLDVRGIFCEKLAGYFPGEVQISLVNSGTETIEGALKFARAITGRCGIVYMRNAFHGRTMGALSACGTKKYQRPAEPLIPNFHMTTYGDIDAFKELIGELSEVPAAVIIEPIQGESGVLEASIEYFIELRKLCDEKGIFLIFDEVQTGVGRTGKFFCFEHFVDESGMTCVPDIVCVAKALGSGFPIGAIIVKKELAEQIPAKYHGSTFGGGPLACAVGIEVLNIIEEEKILENVTELGAYFKAELEKLAEENDKIREVRGRGFMLAIQLKERTVGYLRKLQEEEGLLALGCGPLAIRFLPPYTVTKEDIDYALEKVRKVLTD